MVTRRTNIVLIGGGSGSSIFTQALKDLPVNLTTIVSSFDDGGSTGALRRDYGGIALGDFRQCIMANMDMEESFVKALNFRFGGGPLFGVNVGNILLKAFLLEYPTEREGIRQLHKALGLRNSVLPVSYDYAKLQATLTNHSTLEDQHQIATYLNFAEAGIRSLSLKPAARLAAEARTAMQRADYLIFAPGHFFTSVLPHVYVRGFADAWRRSRAQKLWFVNLLAHRGQDSHYTLKDYFAWFERSLGKRPFDMVITNRSVPKSVLRQVAHRFERVRIVPTDRALVRKQKMRFEVADLVSLSVRGQQANDTVLRAPLRHDVLKVRRFFAKLLDA
jgi:uncharacterized cofD-like protein